MQYEKANDNRGPPSASAQEYKAGVATVDAVSVLAALDPDFASWLVEKSGAGSTSQKVALQALALSQMEGARLDAQEAVSSLMDVLKKGDQVDGGYFEEIKKRVAEIVSKLDKTDGPTPDAVANSRTLSRIETLDLTGGVPMKLALKGDGHCCVYGLLIAKDDAYFGARSEKVPGQHPKKAMEM